MRFATSSKRIPKRYTGHMTLESAVNFKYFKADHTEIDFLDEAPSPCTLCLQMAPGIPLSCAEWRTFSASGKAHAHGKGCLACLHTGAFTLAHETEPNTLDLISEECIDELSRTPHFRSWKAAPWLTHCDDYMAYLGVWSESNFNACAPEGKGLQLFQDMTNAEQHSLWLNPAWGRATSLEAQGPTYYAFQCLHCGKLRGFWDAP